MAAQAFLNLQKQLKQIDNSKVFQGFVISIIVISAISIGVHTYQLSPELNQLLLFLDRAVTYFFLFELVVRFFATENWKVFFRRGWNIFDTVIVIGSLLPIAGTTILLARLLRIFRVLRLISLIPELRLLVDALIKSLPKMSYIALLMFVIFYIYAAVGSTLFASVNQELWGDVAIALLTLFRVATFEDWTDVMYETMDIYPLSWIFYLSFIFLTAFIFLNMMVGVILEVMTEEQESYRKEQQNKQLIMDNMPATQGQINALKQEVIELKQLLIKQTTR